MRRSLGLFFLTTVVLSISGCGVAPRTTLTPEGQPVVHAQGRVHGGQQPVAGSTVQVWSPGTSGDGSAATQVTASTQTDSSGNFTLPNTLSCSSSSTAEVYVTATGGQPLTGVTNSNLAMMTAVGLCSSWGANTFISINEVTTVGAVSALASFMSSYSAVGSGSSDATSLTNAFTLAEEFVDSSTGLSPGNGVPSGYVAPSAEIYTLANILASCVNSSGGTASGTSCGNLFLVTPSTQGAQPTDTVGAMLNIALNPSANVTTLFNLVPASAPFQNQLTSPPSNFSVQLALDTSGVGYFTVNPGSVPLGSAQTGWTTAQQTVSVTNTGSAAATITSYSIVGTNASDFAIYLPNGYSSGDLCDYTVVAAGETCTFSVIATPTATGSRSAYLEIVSTAANSPQMVPLSATGTTSTGSPLTLSPTSLSFDVAGAFQDVTVSNLSAGPVLLNQPSFSAVNFGVTNACGTSLAAQSVCFMSIESTDDNYVNSAPPVDNATMTVSTTTGASASVGLTSQNVARVTTAASGYQGLSIVFQDGSAYYGINAAASLGTQTGFYLSASRCSTTAYDYGGSGSCTITAESYTYVLPAYVYVSASSYFIGSAPSSEYVGTSPNATGTYTAKISGTSSLSVWRVAEGSNNPYLPKSPTATFTVTNNGSSVLNLTAAFSGAGSSELSATLSGCSSLAVNASCTGVLSLADGPAVNETANLILKDISNLGSFVIPVSLTRTWAVISRSTTALSFGNQNYGTTSSAQTVTITDQNGYPLNHPISAAISAGAPFAFQGSSTCAASLTATCPLAVVFAPTAGGAASGTLTVTDGDSLSTVTVSLSGTGLTGAPAVTMSPTSLTFSQRNAGTTSIAMPVTLTNSGTGTATLNVSSVSLGAATGFSQTNNCGSAKLAANAYCTIQVTFAPQTTGPFSGTLSVVSNSASSPDSILVSGTAQ